MSSLPLPCGTPDVVGLPSTYSSSEPSHHSTSITQEWRHRGAAALNSLVSGAYRELVVLARALMRRERPGHLLEASALVHEAYIRLAEHGTARWESLTHFFATAAYVMRQILVDYARWENAGKRGGGLRMTSITDPAFVEPVRNRDASLEALDDTLAMLVDFDQRKARVVEMRFFGGLNFHEIGEALGLSAVTVRRDWSAARTWLYREMSRPAEGW